MCEQWSKPQWVCYINDRGVAGRSLKIVCINLLDIEANQRAQGASDASLCAHKSYKSNLILAKARKGNGIFRCRIHGLPYKQTSPLLHNP